MKMEKKDACAVTYFGDGGTSEVNNPKKILVLELFHLLLPQREDF